jgi:hypothetical protein
MRRVVERESKWHWATQNRDIPRTSRYTLRFFGKEIAAMEQIAAQWIQIDLYGILPYK